MKRLRVTHVITDLQTGGAEVMLQRLLGRLDRSVVDSQVISLRQTIPVGEAIRATGIPVEAVGMSRWPSPVELARLALLMRRFAPDVVQTWMLHADLVGGAVARALGARVAWGIHIGVVDRKTHGLRTYALQRAEALLSHVVPGRIVSCSETSRDEMVRLGYDPDRIDVLPNGFDLERFRPDPAARRAVRQELGLSDDALVVGNVSRFHPQKDHETLLAAARLVAAARPDVHFVLCGRGVTLDSPELRSWSGPLGSRVQLLGERRDAARLTSAFDVSLSSSSYGEAFPLVIGEAMASEVPCVATRCGDSAAMIGDTGRTAPIRDPRALADALLSVLSLPPDERRALGRAARQRIAERYELGLIASRYLALWRELASAR